MLETKNLTKIYKPKKGMPVKAIDNISLRFPNTGMVFLLGKSGSGKSTLLNLLGGLDRYDGGEIIIKGVSSKNFNQSHFDSYRNTYVGFIFQEYNVLEEFTVGANIALALELQGKKADNAVINEILKEVDLEGYGARRPNELSGGQKQRVAIARALVKRPEIIMADEPTGALDSNTGKQVFDTLKKLSADKLVIVVSHDRDFAEQYADRIIELADGRVISDVELDGSAASNAADPDKTGLVYSGDYIEVPENYELTEEDRIAINEYIKNLKSGVRISAEKKLSGRFKDTDQSKIVSENQSKFRLIRSKLPLKNAFKIGASGLKHKKIRLVFTILLSVVAFSLFGLSDVVGSYNHIRTCTQSILDSNVKYAAFQKTKRSENQDDVYYSLGNYYFDDADINNIKENTGLDCYGVYIPSATSYGYNISFESQFYIEYNSYDMFSVYARRFSGFAEIGESELEGMGCRVTAGRLPDGDKDEIAISEYVCRSFIKGGYRALNAQDSTSDGSDPDGNYIAVSKSADMIGKTILIDGTEYTVTGIIETGFDFDRYSKALEEIDMNSAKDQLIAYALNMEFQNETEYSLSNVVFTGKGFIERFAKFHPVKYSPNKGFFSIMSTSVDKDYISIHTKYISKYDDSIARAVTWIDGERDTLGEREIIVPLSAINESDYSYGANSSSPDVDKLKNAELSLLGAIYNSEDIEESGYKIVGYIDDEEYPDQWQNLVVSDSMFDRFCEQQNGIYSRVVGAMPESYSDVYKIVSYSYSESSEFRYQLTNAVVYELDLANDLFIVIGKVFLYVGIGFAVFASLMFANFIGTSIAYKKQEIGILRAIGSRANDVFRIFFSESFIIASINFLLSCIGTGLITLVINNTIRSQTNLLITVLHFGVRQVVLILAVSMVVAFIASFIPVRRIAAKKPIDAIRNR